MGQHKFNPIAIIAKDFEQVKKDNPECKNMPKKSLVNVITAAMLIQGCASYSYLNEEDENDISKKC